MGYYGLLNRSGLELVKSKKMLTRDEMRDLVGVKADYNYFIVGSSKSFSDTHIDLVCGDESINKGHDPTCVTREGYTLHGQILILGSDVTGGNFQLLTKKQAEIVRTQVKFLACLIN